MKSLKLIMLAALVLTLAGLGQATTIALVSDADAPDVNVGGIDDSYVSFLEGLGYTVDTTGMGGNFKEGATSPFAAGNEAKLAVLESADLVIISRKTNSGAYDNDRMGWNSLATPLLLNSGYLTRGESSSKRWGWTTGGSSDADKTATDLDIIGAHPFLPVPQIFDWSLASTAPEAPKGVYLPNSSGEVVGGEVIGEFEDDRPFLIDFAAGIDLDAGNGTTDKYGVLGARRAFLAHWGYDGEVAGETFRWDDFITDDYKDILAGTVAQMIPEPATMVLLGLGGLMLRRRR